MTDHPLTDEICDQIQDSIHPCDPENMRAAVDWQLEQVIEWIKNCRDCDLFYIKDRDLMNFKMRRELQKAMRPQENS